MLQELTHMDRITQLQEEIEQLLIIISDSLAYLTSRSNFLQVSAAAPVTRSRNPEKYNVVAILEGAEGVCYDSALLVLIQTSGNKLELVTHLVAKSKQVEYLMQSLPQPEEEEDQVRGRRSASIREGIAKT
ncbi:hypothetical protein DFS33DRAFT_786151 [Desarmillaria ectypa]|nr:hypothetical protein DFS33DRAFT_786151 [Desarmillaria ectypa]